MFDANAVGIPVGKKFFAEVHSVNAELAKMGIIKGDIILCEHIEKVKSGKWCEETVNTKIWTKQDKDSGHYFYDDSKESGYGLLVYSGCPDGTGFINDAWKQKALDFLGGEWNV
tara:strand:- start:170 stop:511 length:342 start_codon:yes stop_codon:yes gene_type:complete